MKLIIAVVLLAAVVGVFSAQPNLSPEDEAKIQEVLQRIGGPKVANLATKIVKRLVNGVLDKVPINAVIKSVTNLVRMLAKEGGTVDELLSAGNKDALSATNSSIQSNGKIKNLTPADQQELQNILEQTVGSYSAKYIVQTLTLATDGIIAKVPLNKILHGVTGIVQKVLNPKSLVSKLTGSKGLGKPVSTLLGVITDLV